MGHQMVRRFGFSRTRLSGYDDALVLFDSEHTKKKSTVTENKRNSLVITDISDSEDVRRKRSETFTLEVKTSIFGIVDWEEAAIGEVRSMDNQKSCLLMMSAYKR